MSIIGGSTVHLSLMMQGVITCYVLQRILQPYVDDLFKGIFAVPRGKPLAKGIKFLYDFLDLQVSNLSVIPQPTHQ